MYPLICFNSSFIYIYILNCMLWTSEINYLILSYFTALLESAFCGIYTETTPEYFSSHNPCGNCSCSC